MNVTFLKKLGIDKIHSGAFDGTWRKTKGDLLPVRSPVDGKQVGQVRMATKADYAAVSKAAHAAFLRWRELPAPERGEYVRRIGNAFREHKELLGKLVTLEAGKIVQEGLGEVQECIDIADFAVGLSRHALRPDDPERARAAPHARDLASARHGRDHHRVQLPGRGLGMELDARARLRRQHACGSRR